MNDLDRPVTEAKKQEIWLALRNGIKLVISLVITLAIAFSVRFWMPTFLGPETFGILNFAESFAMMFFIFATLGAYSYILKEVAVRKEHASEFFGVLMLAQTVVAILLTITMTMVLFYMGKSSLVFRVVYLFIVGQFFFVTNAQLMALLQATGTVNEVAIVNSVSKVLWGAGIIVGLIFWGRIEIVATVFLFTEALKTTFFYNACKKHLGLVFRIDWIAGKAMLLASLPYFLNTISHTIAGRVDVVMMSAMTVDQEVGWYGAAANVNSMVLLVMPVVIAVVAPMSARIAKQGVEELNTSMRAMVRLVLVITIPMALIVALNAEDIVLLLLSSAYLPSVNTLRILASNVPLIFMSTLMAIQLVQLEKIWQLATISIISVMVNPILNLFFIPPIYEAIGDGGAGMAAAVATVVTQMVVVTLMFSRLKAAAFDSRTGTLLLRFAILCGIMIAVHFQLEFLGILRGPVELVLYPALAVPLGVLPVKDILQRGRAFLAERKNRN